MPALGCGTLIPDAAATISATTDALEAGFRHFDCAERYRNEREVGRHLCCHQVVEQQLDVLLPIYESARIKPAVVQVGRPGLFENPAIFGSAQDCGPRAGEFQYHRPLKEALDENQSNSN